MRVAFVIQRYGPDVAGGAERLCRRTAHALAAAGHEITVLSTTAEDVTTWAPRLAAGIEHDGDIAVRRFDALPADPVLGASLLHQLALGRGQFADESRWVAAHGPVSHGLLAAVSGTDHDLVVFWTYLFATTQLGVPLAADRSVLVPAAHDEPMLRFAVTRGVMALAAGFAFLTPEERELVEDYHPLGDRPWQVVGSGMSPPADAGNGRGAPPRGTPPRFVLYLGRKDAGKGVPGLINAHRDYRRGGGALELVLAGPGGRVAGPEWLHDLGYVDERTRAGLVDACEALVLPSIKESLSLVLAEAWQAGRPTLANAYSEVASGQTDRSDAGLLYADRAGYVRQLSALEADGGLRRRLGENGRRWARAQTWDAAVDRWERLLDQVLARRLSEASG